MTPLAKKACLRFLASAFVLLLLADEARRANKLALCFRKRRIKIRRHSFAEELSSNNLAKFQLNWSSGCRDGVENVRTTRQNFTFEKKRKIILYFLRRLASNEIMTPKCPVSSILVDTREGSAFSNNRTLTGNM